MKVYYSRTFIFPNIERIWYYHSCAIAVDYRSCRNRYRSIDYIRCGQSFDELVFPSVDCFRHLLVSACICIGSWTSSIHNDSKTICQKGRETIKAKDINKLPDSDVPSCTMLSVLNIFSYFHSINVENRLYIYIHRNVLLLRSVYKFGV